MICTYSADDLRPLMTEEKLKSYGHRKKSVQCFTEAVVSKKTRGLFYYRAACSLPAFVPFILAKRYFDRF